MKILICRPSSWRPCFIFPSTSCTYPQPYWGVLFCYWLLDSSFHILFFKRKVVNPRFLSGFMGASYWLPLEFCFFPSLYRIYRFGYIWLYHTPIISIHHGLFPAHLAHFGILLLERWTGTSLTSLADCFHLPQLCVPALPKLACTWGLTHCARLDWFCNQLLFSWSHHQPTKAKTAYCNLAVVFCRSIFPCKK